MTRNEAVPNQPRAVLCRGTTKAGKPCRAIAGGGGLCAIHAGRVDPCAIGRSGGLARTRSQLGISPELADDQLRAQARRRLEALVNSDDERTALAAARALYSYGPQRPPAGEAQTEHQPIVQQYDEFAIVAMLEQVGLVRRCDLTLSDPQKVALLDAARASLEGGGAEKPGTSHEATGETEVSSVVGSPAVRGAGADQSSEAPFLTCSFDAAEGVDVGTVDGVARPQPERQLGSDTAV